MPLASPSLVKVFTACAVVIAFLLADTGQARAGCGDHGYVVQRANGEVVVVTPSHPACPCQGPQCRQSKPPIAPVSPVPSPPPAENAWGGDTGLVDTLFCWVPMDPPAGDKPLVGHFAEILQPPRF